jgi:hypothetical protein
MVQGEDKLYMIVISLCPAPYALGLNEVRTNRHTQALLSVLQ